MAAEAANERSERTTHGPDDRAGQDVYLDAAYRAEAAALRGRLLALTRNPAVADDLVAAAFVRLVAQVRAGDPPEDEIVRRERDGVVREALATLDEDDREVVLMAASGYRPVEIAGITGRSSEATRTRLCRARGRLRGTLLAGGLLS